MSEYTLSKTVAVDCTRGAPCRNVIPIISTLKVDLECEGYNTQPALRPAIHSGDSMQLYEPAPVWDTYPGIGFDITLRDANNVQVETKKKKWIILNLSLKKKTVPWKALQALPSQLHVRPLGLVFRHLLGLRLQTELLFSFDCSWH